MKAPRGGQFVALGLALLLSASTWFYIERILKPAQIAYDAAHQRPRGNFSDLYPRWLGARELLLHGRNPYSPDITREIQRGYYGRPLDPAHADDPKDEQGFAYPVYVVFLLWPSIDLPFEVVQSGFRWLLIGLIAGSVVLWIRSLERNISITGKLTIIVLMLGWLPTVQGIKLQQLTLLVFAVLAMCAACLQARWYVSAGVLLALATIKPQLAWLLVAWLVLWTFKERQACWRFLLGFGVTMILLLAGAELVLPGWWRMFFAAMRQYRGYTSTESVSVALFGVVAGRIFEILSLLACAVLLWRWKKIAHGKDLAGVIALVLALTVLLIPKTAPYNQVLLLPAILGLLGSERSEDTLPAIRLANRVGGLVLAWPWIATVVLSATYLWLTPDLRHRLSLVPFYSNLMIPVLVSGLALLNAWNTAAMNHADTLRDGAQAE